MKGMKFYGSTTIGERGQIVLPINLRKDFKINKGDKLLVVGNPNVSLITLINADTMDSFLETIGENISQMRSKIKKKGYE
jgi:bifunctional DNA-binding transcriptional regulator/antitoxin component of YhaV-PrlF toxin-antitoxin module